MTAGAMCIGRFAVDDGAQDGSPGAGDASASAELYRRYYVRLVRLCEGRVGDPHLAEDIAQETLLLALRYLHGYDTTRPMWPWLRKIAVRVAYQAVQKLAAERCTDIEPEELDNLPAHEPPQDVDQWVVLRTALQSVPARQRAALVLRYVDDWSTADSAEMYGLQVAAFEQLLWRARRRLSTEYLRIA